MTKDVLVSIKGTHMRDEDNENIELVVPAKYSFEEGIDKITYDELVEGSRQSIKNTISVDMEGISILKEGFTNSNMNFYKNGKKHITYYNTPYGEFVMGILTKNIDIQRSEDRLKVSVDYLLDIGENVISDCNIVVDVRSKQA
jgi:hypothetical protein